MIDIKRLYILAAALGIGLLPAPSADAKDTVSLVVDYSDGARKTFAHLPWTDGMDILDVLHRAAKQQPGLVVEEVDTIRSGETSVALDCAQGGWTFWINQHPHGRRLRPGGADANPFAQRVQPGDVVLAKSTGSGGTGAPTAAASEPAAALTIDYSNGVEKIFVAVPWHLEMNVLELLAVAAQTGPGLEVDFGVFPNPNDPRGPLADRADHEIGALRALDGVGGDGNAWQVWIDGRDLGTELRTRSRFSGGTPRIAPGDAVLLKQVASEQAHVGPWHEPSEPVLIDPAAGPACS